MAELGKIWADDSDTAKIAKPLYIEGSQTWYSCHHLPLNLSSSFSSEHFTLVSWPCNQISQLGRNPDPVNIHRLIFTRSLLCSLVSSLVTKATMTRRIPSAVVVAAFLLGSWSADAFQPHARVSSVRPSRAKQNGITLDMISVFGRDVQVSLLFSQARDGI